MRPTNQTGDLNNFVMETNDHGLNPKETSGKLIMNKYFKSI
jgi:hypothetical protein